jgi:uncharacterized membrane protein
LTPLSNRLATLLFLVILGLITLFFAAIWVMGWFRRHYLFDKEEKTEEEPPYTIMQLREMYEDGIITGEEFERLRRKIYGRRPYPSSRSPS